MDIGRLRHRVALDAPGPIVPDNEGGYTQSRIPLVPSPVWASVESATPHALERTIASTIEAKASHIVRMRYHPQVNTQTRLTFNGRILNVKGVQNQNEQNEELVLTCEEVVL